MSESTLKSIAVGVGVAVLLIFVGTMSYMVARPDGESDPQANSAGQETNTGGASSTTTESTQDPGVTAESVPPTAPSTAPPQRDFAEHFADLRTAIARVDAVTCDTVRQGTAFLISSDVLVTAADVVVNTTEIGVAIDGESTQASVIGLDSQTGVAVLRLAEPLDVEQVLDLTKEPTRVGNEVAALVEPAGLPLTMVVGRVVSIDPDAEPADQIRTDADIDAGSAGGPVIDDRGQVVGVVGAGSSDGGPLHAISVPSVRRQILDWIQAPDSVDPAFCVGDVDLDEIDTIAPQLIAADVEHPEIAAVQRTYAVYSQSINSSRAEGAFGVLGPAITRNNTPEAWAEGQRTSKLWDWRIRSVENTADGLLVRSVFTSTQDAEFAFDGESTCTRWDITHNLVSGTFREQEYWLINRSRPTEGSGPVDCLEWSPEVLSKEALALETRTAEIGRSDRLPGGTVHDWTIAVGDVLDGEATPTEPLTLAVRVDADSGFDPVVEIYDQFENLVAQSEDVAEESQVAEAQFTATRVQVLTVRVRDAADRSGGAYDLTFTSSPG